MRMFFAALVLCAASLQEDPYNWTRVLPAESGCWPDCSEGEWCWPTACGRGRPDQWPRSVTPIVARGKLWMIANSAAWSSGDGLRWNQVQLQTEWRERYGMTAIFFRDRFWKMGGMQKSWDDFRNDVWSSPDAAHWSRVTTRAAWTPRRGHSLVDHQNKLWLLGGVESSGRSDQLPTRLLRDVWNTTDGVNWQRITNDAPWVGNVHVVVLQGRLVVIAQGSAWSSTDGRFWQPITRSHPALDRGGNGVAGCLVFDGKIWIFGGLDAHGTRNDVWWSRDGATWKQAPFPPWSPRGGEHSVTFRDAIWIFGGKSGSSDQGSGYHSDVWRMTRAAP